MSDSTAKADLDELIRMLEYGRKNGVRIGPEVTIGCISVKVADLRQPKKEGLVRESNASIYHEHGLSEEEDP